MPLNMQPAVLILILIGIGIVSFHPTPPPTTTTTTRSATPRSRNIPLLLQPPHPTDPETPMQEGNAFQLADTRYPSTRARRPHPQNQTKLKKSWDKSDSPPTRDPISPTSRSARTIRPRSQRAREASFIARILPVPLASAISPPARGTEMSSGRSRRGADRRGRSRAGRLGRGLLLFLLRRRSD